MNLKKYIKKNIINFKNKFKIKIPVKIPVFYGELLNNKTALITGGSSGIGAAIAKAFVNNGCNVIITGRNENKLKDVVETLKKDLKKDLIIDYIVWDIADVEQIEECFNRVIQKYDINILVNNAGIMLGDSIGKTKINEFEKTMKTNLEAMYFLTQYFAEYMIKNKICGNILNISSSSSIRPAITPYAISKWGINGLTKGCAKKYINDGIVVNAIAPGPTATSMLGKDENDINHLKIPAKRYILPEEVANIATILVSSLGKMIVGETVYITGGAGNLTFDDIEY